MHGTYNAKIIWFKFSSFGDHQLKFLCFVYECIYTQTLFYALVTVLKKIGVNNKA